MSAIFPCLSAHLGLLYPTHSIFHPLSPPRPTPPPAPRNVHIPPCNSIVYDIPPPAARMVSTAFRRGCAASSWVEIGEDAVVANLCTAHKITREVDTEGPLRRLCGEHACRLATSETVGKKKHSGQFVLAVCLCEVIHFFYLSNTFIFFFVYHTCIQQTAPPTHLPTHPPTHPPRRGEAVFQEALSAESPPPERGRKRQQPLRWPPAVLLIVCPRSQFQHECDS